MAFYTALDVLDDAISKTGTESEPILSQYWEQRRSGMVPPQKVLDRMALATQRWETKAI